MIKHPDWGKDELTNGDILGPPMKVENAEEANAFLEEYVDWLLKLRPRQTRHEVMRAAKHNLAYYAGYYDDDTRVRVEKYFDTAHPALGKLDPENPMTPREAFELGRRMGEEDQSNG